MRSAAGGFPRSSSRAPTTNTGRSTQVRAIERRSPAPVTSLVLEACRHSPQIDQPQATLEAIVRFCAASASAIDVNKRP